MRVLATIAFAFSFGIFTSVLLPWDGWQLWTAIALLMMAVIALAVLHKNKLLRKRVVVILCALSL